MVTRTERRVGSIGCSGSGGRCGVSGRKVVVMVMILRSRGQEREGVRPWWPYE